MFASAVAIVLFFLGSDHWIMRNCNDIVNTERGKCDLSENGHNAEQSPDSYTNREVGLVVTVS